MKPKEVGGKMKQVKDSGEDAVGKWIVMYESDLARQQVLREIYTWATKNRCSCEDGRQDPEDLMGQLLDKINSLRKKEEKHFPRKETADILQNEANLRGINREFVIILRELSGNLREELLRQAVLGKKNRVKIVDNC